METLHPNNYSKAGRSNLSFFKRFYLYQNERFPLVAHALLIASFSFSAISYSRISRGAHGFVNWQTYLIGIFITTSLFLLGRIAKELKDAADNALHEQQFPVTRGLVSFQELSVLGIVLMLLQIAIHLLFFPKMLLIYFIIILYLSFMTKKMFIIKGRKRYRLFYVASHLLIIPLIDIYASGLDWFITGVTASKGLIFFFAISYMNGIVLEIGRKIRLPENEKKGERTYSSMLGINKASLLWMTILFITLCLSFAASYVAGYGMASLVVLGTLFMICSLPAILFLHRKTECGPKAIERAALVWTIMSYLTLGAMPMIQQLIF